MPDVPKIKAVFNDDDEIIARLDECELAVERCVEKNCPMCKNVLKRRVEELRQMLLKHSMV